MNPCPETTRPPVVTWRVQAEAGHAFVFSIIDGAWHWRLDAANAAFSPGYPSYPAAMAAARRYHGLPAIGATAP